MKRFTRALAFLLHRLPMFAAAQIGWCFRRKLIATLATVFVLTLQLSAQGKVKVLHNFGASNDGSVPSGPLVVDSRGNLYGVTEFGPGLTGSGAVFALTPQKDGGWHENILHDFTAGSGGAFPWGGLIFDNAGNLYGTAEGQGTYAVGGVFELGPSTSGWNFSMLYSDGAGPGVLFDESGNLFGEIGPTNNSGLGAIGELAPGSGGWTYTQLYSTCTSGCFSGGYGPLAPPIWDGHGNLWGTMAYGGLVQRPCFNVQGCGVIFEMMPNGDGTWTYNLIHQFASSSTDGQSPFGGLVMDSAGNFYGGTLSGGAYNNGTIFKFSNIGGTWQQTILYDFPSCNQGCRVQGTLAMDAVGNLYGTASGGTQSCGFGPCGVVFRLSPQSNGAWTYTMLANLTVTTGGGGLYGVTLDAEGNLYGAAKYSGKYGEGTAFELTP